MFDNACLITQCADHAGIPVERLYKSKRIEKSYFGKKLTTNRSDTSGDIYFDAIKNLTTFLGGMIPFAEFVTEQDLNRRQEEDLRRSTYVHDFEGVLTFFIPSIILDEIENPVIVCENESQEIDYDSGYKVAVCVSKSLWICAY